jgi:hypothetical protein
MKREVYVDGKRFGTIKSALAYLSKRWGKRVDYREFRRAADRDGSITAGKRKAVRVSWKGEDPVKEQAEPAPREFRKGEPLLRYPPGEGPRYDGSRGWK